MDTDIIMSYQDVLAQIKGKENHLLLANGFNSSLGVGTSYKDIFKKMIELNPGLYNEATSLIVECGWDLEKFLGELGKAIKPGNIFLEKYAQSKVKMDFMEAAHQIVKSKIKGIYAEKNEGIFLLLQNFCNYFTLNYDSFLYLLLMHYKPTENLDQDTIAFQSSLPFMARELNLRENNIYEEIKKAREEGVLRMSFGADEVPLESDLNKLTKTDFTASVNLYNKENKKGWKVKEINRVVSLILEDEKKIAGTLERVDDGSRQQTLFGPTPTPELVFEEQLTQNLFFLHGAFHIYKDRNFIKKITQQTDKALYDKIEEVISTEGSDIVCVFQSENKKEAINDNEYLKRCYDKLKELSGNMVIIGSSLDDNDDHIFTQINKSSLSTIYISVFDTDIKKLEEFSAKAKRKFSDKRVLLFDAKTISYDT